jgi:hypothetical protein
LFPSCCVSSLVCPGGSCPALRFRGTGTRTEKSLSASLHLLNVAGPGTRAADVGIGTCCACPVVTASAKASSASMRFSLRVVFIMLSAPISLHFLDEPSLVERATVGCRGGAKREGQVPRGEGQVPRGEGKRGRGSGVEGKKTAVSLHRFLLRVHALHSTLDTLSDPRPSTLVRHSPLSHRSKQRKLSFL